MALYDYRWATGHNVALGSLTNVETSLLPYMAGYQIAPTSQPVNRFPIRRHPVDGTERGFGTIHHVWSFSVLKLEALDYIIDTFLVTSSAEVTYKAVTIYTRTQDRGRTTYVRYNANICYPHIGEDYRVEGDEVVQLNLRFRDLRSL